MVVSHRMTGSPEYRSWAAMLNRCRNVKRSTFERYVVRGITVCKRWTGAKGFNNFLIDMGKKPSPRHGIERKDNNKGYSPKNCVWATQRQQCNNKEMTILVMWRGKKTPLAYACEAAGLPYHTVYARLSRLGWSDYDALHVPVGGRR